MPYWITSKGIDYLTSLIDKSPSKYTGEDTRRQDILGIMELEGGGYSPGQIITMLEKRDIRNPLWGTKDKYLSTLQSLEKGGYIQEV